MRHLVRWHQRIPSAPDARSFAVVTALAMAFVASSQSDVVSAPSVPSTPVAAVTALDGSTGRLEANVQTARADVRWRVVEPRRPAPSPTPAAHACASGSQATAMDRLSESDLRAGVDAASRAELAAVQVFAEPRGITLTSDALCPGTDSMLAWYAAAERLATAELKAERRAAARRIAKAKAVRVAKAKRQTAARKAARQRELRAAHKAAARRAAARKAAKHRAARPGTSGGWRVAPIVTWYGPGFYGNRTACGVRYTRSIIGVAHRTLPCGTLVRFQWHGMTAVAPVIDRGPYASADFVFDFSAALSCEVFKPKGIRNSCFTRHDVRWQVVGRVNLKQYLASH